MKKWIMMAAANWLRKPENQQKAKSAWNKFRDRKPSEQTPQPQPTSRNNTERRPSDSSDNRL
ncbi:hypothetical protein GCM10009022_16390 [Vreelandella titanicae]